MTNRTDLDKCCAQIELIEQLINQPETFDIRKVLVELETKKGLLMKYKPRDYATILRDFNPEKKTNPPEVKEDISLIEIKDGREMLKQANNALAEKEKELKAEAEAKAKLEKAKIVAEAKFKKEREAKKALETTKAAEIEALQNKLKILQEVKLEGIKEEIPGE